MASEEMMKLAEGVIEEIGDEGFLDHLLRSMSDPELIGHVQHIAEEEDINLGEDDDDDDPDDGKGDGDD